MGDAMQRWMLSATARTRTGLVLLSVLLAALAGCATGEKVKPQAAASAPPAAAAPPVASAPAGPSVTPLPPGRDGFIITENAALDGESRADFERAVVLMRQGDNAAAGALFEKVVERSPGVTAPYINLAIVCRGLGRIEEAEQHLKTALALVPGHPAASNEYGLLLRRHGRFAEARSVYEGALAAFPGYLPVRRNLGILCDLYMNDLACALEQYEFYSQAMPQDEQVKIWVADLRTRLKR